MEFGVKVLAWEGNVTKQKHVNTGVDGVGVKVVA